MASRPRAKKLSLARVTLEAGPPAVEGPWEPALAFTASRPPRIPMRATAPSGEHGIGRVRAHVLPRVWGSAVYAAVRAIKEAMDPHGLLKPGVLFSSAEWWATSGHLEDRQPL